LNTEANFFHIFFQKKKILKIVKYLKSRKFLVASKYLGSYKSYNDSLRITYGSIQQLKVFFKMLDSFLTKNK
jgi:histidinol-phosphate/aromatic aminotransferase/cobyric acid decarboxylase-like protein